MEHLKENDACPCCWHRFVSIGGQAGIATYSIEELILFEGGILDKYGTCNNCRWNFVFVRNCKHCKENQPCSKHYANGYNGVYNKHMPLVMHRLYMRNSPYKRSWDDRPGSIGEWYASQASTYMEAISLLKRLTSNWKIQSKLLDLEKIIIGDVDLFWPCLKNISEQYLSEDDKISTAVKSFCYVLWSKQGNIHN
tara:strand:+ start:305 stop:889 length:585 start_codon:yes stop_codon:yes gene_type:complete